MANIAAIAGFTTAGVGVVNVVLKRTTRVERAQSSGDVSRPCPPSSAFSELFDRPTFGLGRWGCSEPWVARRMTWDRSTG
jgi:hypothetical protein